MKQNRLTHNDDGYDAEGLPIVIKDHQKSIFMERAAREDNYSIRKSVNNQYVNLNRSIVLQGTRRLIL